MNWRYLAGSACAFRFSQPLGAFFRFEPAGHISCRIRSWGFPSGLCTPLAAVRCLQRRCPLAVPSPPVRSNRTRRCETDGDCAFRALLRERIRLPNMSCLGSSRARGPPGFPPLQGTHLGQDGATFAAPPLMWLEIERQACRLLVHFRVLLTAQGGWSLSRLPSLMGFVAL